MFVKDFFVLPCFFFRNAILIGDWHFLKDWNAGLGARLAELFNANVSLEWDRKYTQKNQ
mgnify:CR=1 FL=1